MKQESGLRAFEIKWSRRRVSSRAFRDAYGVEVEAICPDDPFAADPFKDKTVQVPAVHDPEKI